MNFFEVLINPNREKNPERAEVARAANLLQLGEFQLLQLSYADWHGQDLPQGAIDTLFSSYMLKNQVPHWARHYARRIIAMDTAGTLDDHNPAYHRFYPAVPHQRHGGVGQFSMATAAVMICVFGRLWISHQAASNGTSYLPSYFDERELKTTR